MQRRRFLAAAAAATTVGVAGCSGGDGQPEVNEEDIAETISIQQGSFEPDQVEIAEGEAVRWTNERDNRALLVRTPDLGDSWEFEHELDTDESAEYLFQSSGVYPFHDRYFSRSQMCGVVIVGDATPDDVPELPCRSTEG